MKLPVTAVAITIAITICMTAMAAQKQELATAPAKNVKSYESQKRFNLIIENYLVSRVHERAQ